MNSGFYYRNNILYCDTLSIENIIDRVGFTPFYLYSSNSIVNQLRKLKAAFSFADLHYAMKANSNHSILKLIRKNCAGLDVVSGGEIYRGIKSGFSPSEIIYSGVGKTGEEIKYALKCGIYSFNTESFPEILNINRISKGLNKIAPIGLRINPDVNPKTHKHIATGLSESKFGIDSPEVLTVIKKIGELKNIKLKGLSIHIGSQILSGAPYIEALKKIFPIIKNLNVSGPAIEYLDLGGGFGISYTGDKDLEIKILADKIRELVNFPEKRYKIIIEPGRFITGHSGALITGVQYVKKKRNKTFIIVDAGMNDLIRPAFYEAYHRVCPVKKTRNKKLLADVVGPICESGDYFAKKRLIARVAEGAFLAILEAGAYGSSMSSTYNSRPLVAEIMIEEGKIKTIRGKGTYEDLSVKEV